MPICPLCEHAQDAAGRCEVCGREAPAVTGAPLADEPLEGLERTHFPRTNVALPPLLAELEPTALAPAAPATPGDGTPAAGRPDWLLPTPDAGDGAGAPGAAPPVDPAEAAPLEVERTSGGPPPPRTAPAPAACRYCRTPAPEGAAFCGACGMALPRPRPPSSEAAEAGAESWTCRGCGTPSRGPLCAGCGARRPEP